MTSRSWSTRDLSPAMLDTALEASRRSGLSLDDWLNSAINDSARADGVAPPPPGQRPNVSRELADIHDRLDSITRQIERVSRSTAQPAEGHVARQLNDAISRLDQRLAGLSQQAAQATAAPRQNGRSATSSEANSTANSFDAAVAEIAARMGELDSRSRPQRAPAPQAAPQTAAPQTPPPVAPDMSRPISSSAAPAASQPAAFQPDLAGLERHINRLSQQMDAWRPAQIEQSISGFREELSEIRRSITEAMPRRVLESLENEVRAVARRLDESRHNGADNQVLSGIERGLSEIREALHTMKPAEQFAGFDSAIGNLSNKLDLIVRSSEHGGVKELEAAIGALRGLVSQVASGEAVAQLHADVQTLASRVDQLAMPSHSPGLLTALEQRITLLTEALETRDRTVPDSGNFDGALRALSERIDRLQVNPVVDASALEHLEQRIGAVLQRVENAAASSNNSSESAPLGRIEEGLSQIIAFLESQREGMSTILNSEPQRVASPSIDPDAFDAVRRELSDIRFGQSEAERRSQDSLEVVHNALNQVVDRLSGIENDLRQIKTTPPQRAAETPRPGAPQIQPRPAFDTAPRDMNREIPREPMAPSIVPTLPNPAALVPSAPLVEPRHAMPRETMPRPGAVPEQAMVPAFTDEARPAAPTVRPPSTPRPPIDPNLPPDHPLEPGVRPQDLVAASASDRIAASEALLKDAPMSGHESATKANFIAAARRAAQQAVAATPPKPGRVAVLTEKLRPSVASTAPAAPDSPSTSTFSTKLKAVLVGASVAIILFGAARIAMNMLGSSDSAEPTVEQPEKSSAIVPPPGSKVVEIPQRSTASSVVASSADPAIQYTQSIFGPGRIENQKIARAVDKIAEKVNQRLTERAGPAESAPIGIPANQMAAAPAQADVTGTIATSPKPAATPATLATAPAPENSGFTPENFTDRLPDAIGSAKLRDAALKGDPKAAYEIASRYADGKGVTANYAEAAKWYDRAAQRGLVPALFRLGSLYEKGLGVNKDVGAAKRSYIAAAEGGNAKAMHNLAVLFADGGGQGPDYKTASEWFRKAADYGLADSQYNLAVLFARGIGVEQNLIESYKWFSLAAAQGDADAGKKRDDVAKRMDQAALSAGRLAIQTYVPLTQPEGAVTVAPPAGGWDGEPVKTAKSAQKSKR